MCGIVDISVRTKSDAGAVTYIEGRNTLDARELGTGITVYATRCAVDSSRISRHRTTLKTLVVVK